MVFTQIWYLHKQGLQDQNRGIKNCAEFTLQWWNYSIWRYWDASYEGVMEDAVVNVFEGGM